MKKYQSKINTLIDRVNKSSLLAVYTHEQGDYNYYARLHRQVNDRAVNGQRQGQRFNENWLSVPESCESKYPSE